MTSRSSKLLVPTILTVAGVGVAAGAAYLARQRKGDVKDFVVSRVLEAPAGRSSYTDLVQSLERAGTHLAGRAARATDTPANREVLAHIITIERWGQNRLRVALRDRPFVQDESPAYRPPATLSMGDLRALLSSTRAGTIELTRQLHRHPPQDDVTVEHNSLGPLTAKAWLRYLTQHADLESRRLRGGPDARSMQEHAVS
ncbi:DinB family protein [Deinococcus sp.]|uniref:DinB family protein n=1 Tax=Deinococcus sp. TaxID=47478 RepID=UPI002869A74F|nr:DinB family protein [Deinococcus sp.]